MMKRLHPRTALIYEDHLRRPCKTICDVVRDEQIFGKKMVVIFTERNDNDGPSITNSAEHAILAFCEACNITPDQAIFFERYETHPDDLDQITFEITNDKPTNVGWKRLPAMLAKPVLFCIES